MNPSPFRLSIVSGAPLLAAAVLMLGGCSPSQDAASVVTPAAAQTKPQSQVAVARGKIDVEGGLLDLSSTASGVVQQLLVKEGQSVQKGQLVLRLADDAARADLAVAESELQLAQTKLKTRQDRLPALKATLTRWQAAAKQGAADLQSVDEAVQALRDAGFSDEQVVEILAHVALNLFTNYVNLAFAVPVDFPAVKLSSG